MNKKNKIIAALLLLLVLASFFSFAAAETENEDEDDDDNWDLSDDFEDEDEDDEDDDQYENAQALNQDEETTYIDEVEVQDCEELLDDYTKEVINLYNEQQKVLDLSNKKIAELKAENSALKSRITQFETALLPTDSILDDDSDGVSNELDQYPGEDDSRYSDSDSDGMMDFEDKYPGQNDFDYVDEDNDGIKDSIDSDTGKNTDKDHDGIDDSEDNKDNRPVYVKMFEWIGIK